MNIKMLGIDHSKATVQYRELFSLTKRSKENLIKEFTNIQGVLGCVIISTCNRMEIWLSCDNEYKNSIYHYFCELNNLNQEDYKEYFMERTGCEAVCHLFYLTCGMRSKIIGEDQILSQVKEALSFSREIYCTDNVLEVLFRMSVTAAKKIKTQIHLSKSNKSIVHQVVHTLKNLGHEISGRKCLVIGNGEVGKLAATVFTEEGADVTVTVRQYKSGIVEIPKGCARIDYGERLNHIEECDFIISATASPNVTLQYEQLKDFKFESPKLFIDLAVPRDIEPSVSGIENISLFDIDYFNVDIYTDKLKMQMKQIDNMIEEKINEFTVWYQCKDAILEVKDICRNAATDVNLRLEKRIKQIDINQHEREHLEKSIEDAAGKVINKLMFGLMDNLKPETFQECVEVIKKLY